MDADQLSARLGRGRARGRYDHLDDQHALSTPPRRSHLDQDELLARKLKRLCHRNGPHALDQAPDRVRCRLQIATSGQRDPEPVPPAEPHARCGAQGAEVATTLAVRSSAPASSGCR